MKIERRDVFSFAAWIGSTVALAGLVRWNMQNEMTGVNAALLIGGGVLLLVAFVGNFRIIAGFFRSRGGKLGTNAVVLILGFLGILSLLNFLGFKHSERWDWTPEKRYTLSDETKKVLGGLKEDVQFIHFDKADAPDPLADKMADYTKISPRVSYQLVDPYEHPDIARRYDVSRPGDIVVSSGARTEHLKDSEEQSLTAGILKVTQSRQKSVCFITGHGEHSLTDNGGEGYSRVKSELDRENYIVKSVSTEEEQQELPQCDVVLVAGPSKGYLPEEAEALKKYLEAGGKMLVMVDAGTDPKLEPLLSPFNISLGNDIVIQNPPVSNLGPSAPVVTHYASHSITQALEGRITIFLSARTVGAADKKDYQKPVTDLLMTSSKYTYAVNDWQNKKRTVQFQPGKDQTGPLTIGVVEDVKSGQNPGRLAVIGNSMFAANALLLAQSNVDLFDNTVNWLAQDENLISIRPKPRTSRRVNLSRTEESLFALFSWGILPGAVFLVGIVLWWKRR